MGVFLINTVNSTPPSTACTHPRQWHFHPNHRLGRHRLIIELVFVIGKCRCNSIFVAHHRLWVNVTHSLCLIPPPRPSSTSLDRSTGVCCPNHYRKLINCFGSCQLSRRCLGRCDQHRTRGRECDCELGLVPLHFSLSRK